MADVREAPGPGGTANPGWYADPWGQAGWRWWDGWQWTAWTSGPSTAQAGAGLYAGYAQPAYSGEPRPVAAPKAAPVPAERRRRLVAELLLVLAVFPLPYTLSAIADLISSAVGNGAGKRTPILIKGHPGASFPIELLLVVLPLAAAGLAWYMLSSPGSPGSTGSVAGSTGSVAGSAGGEGGLRAIGLDKANLRGDVALILGIFVLCFAIPIDGGSALLHALGVHTVSPSTGGVPKYFTLIDVANGVTSGIVEEIVVLGYLVRRLEQLALSDLQVLLIAVAVRGSYHLYYGWGVLPILVWAVLSVVLYRRYRRLLPFIIVHVLWDSSLFVASTMSTHDAGVFILAEAGILIPVTFVLWLTWRGRIPRQSAGQSPVGGTL